MNDANCFALSEAIDGSGANYKSVWGVIIGSGFGGSFVYEKKSLRALIKLQEIGVINHYPILLKRSEINSKCPM